MHTVTTRCRICGGKSFEPILDLGNQRLSGVFPDPKAPQPEASPLELIRCTDPGCQLVQLKHSASVSDMYGKTYGYHSSLSPMMESHLTQKIHKLLNFVSPAKGEVILDIGCNDGTLLNATQKWELTRVGIDPSSQKFLQYFQKDIQVVTDFFNEPAVRKVIGDKQCRVITSIAMFYDIEDPLSFMKQIRSLLAPNGVWALELSYLPMMLTHLTYDQICHEHVTYLSLRDMARLTKAAGLRIIDVEFNEVNGGSFQLVVGHENGPYPSQTAKLAEIASREKILAEKAPFERFERRVQAHRDEIRHILKLVRESGKTIAGYGASTKGNIVLNYCNLNSEMIPYISDRNPEKDGLVTPGTAIPIVSHEEMRRRKPDYLMTFIWHFRKEVLAEEKEFFDRGGKMIFVLPRPHVVDRDNYERYLNSNFEDLAYLL